MFPSSIGSSATTLGAKKIWSQEKFDFDQYIQSTLDILAKSVVQLLANIANVANIENIFYFKMENPSSNFWLI